MGPRTTSDTAAATNDPNTSRSATPAMLSATPGNRSPTVRSTNPRSGQSARLTHQHPHTQAALGVAVGDLGAGPRIISAGDDGTVRIWDPDSGEQTAELTGHTGTVLPTLQKRGPLKTVWVADLFTSRVGVAV